VVVTVAVLASVVLVVVVLMLVLRLVTGVRLLRRRRVLRRRVGERREIAQARLRFFDAERLGVRDPLPGARWCLAAGRRALRPIVGRQVVVLHACNTPAS
jgi:hypothetical protein